jgi:site-specific DNA-methyltransferase (adenine-specific)
MINLMKGDCLVESDNVESGSVDLILTDLPYGTVRGIENVNHGMSGKCDWDTVIDTDKIMQIANRVLRRNGKMILTAQHPFTNELINKALTNLPFNYSMIWEKDHFANALTAKKAPLNYYEDILVFSKKYDTELLHPLRKYFKCVMGYIGLNLKQINEKLGHRHSEHAFYIDSTQFRLCAEKTYNELFHVFDLRKMQGFKEFKELKKINSGFNSTFNLWEGNKTKSNILKYDYTGYHPTQKPILLLEDLIKTFSNDGDLVLDLTMGSGTTGVACVNTNRNFIGIEMDETYFEIASKRINEAHEAEKTPDVVELTTDEDW